MSEMIERVALALWPYLPVGMSRAMREKSARAVIEAMREPTKAMIDTWDEHKVSDEMGASWTRPEDAAVNWCIMIDVALGLVSSSTDTKTAAERRKLINDIEL